MKVCEDHDPVLTQSPNGTSVECWLAGPDDLIPEGGTERSEQKEISVADEA
jgi:peptide/nickel transport system ATP-binding protein